MFQIINLTRYLFQIDALEQVDHEEGDETYETRLLNDINTALGAYYFSQSAQHAVPPHQQQ